MDRDKAERRQESPSLRGKAAESGTTVLTKTNHMAASPPIAHTRCAEEQHHDELRSGEAARPPFGLESRGGKRLTKSVHEWIEHSRTWTKILVAKSISSVFRDDPGHLPLGFSAEECDKI